MSEDFKNRSDLIDCEYREITVNREMEDIYVSYYKNFGWKLDSKSNSEMNINTITMKFSREEKIRNKVELTRLQCQLDACISEIISMEKSKVGIAFIASITIGLIGTACIVGATFAYIVGLYPLCIGLAVLASIGCVSPYFIYNSTYARKSSELTPLIESKHDEIYKVCKKANGLLH